MKPADQGPPPYLSVAPRSVAPLVLTCEHASRRFPFPVPRHGAFRDLLASHWAWDIGGWAITRELARRLRTSAIGGRWSRLLIDLNRKVDDTMLIRPAAGGLVLPWNAGLEPEDVEERIERYHTPYHTEVDRLIMRRLVRGMHPLVLAIHTFTPRRDRSVRRFDVGVLFWQYDRLAHRLGRALRGAGLSVRYNEPYSGVAGLMYAAERHGSHHDLACLELEINQGIVESAAGAARIADAVAPAVSDLVAHLRS